MVSVFMLKSTPIVLVCLSVKTFPVLNLVTMLLGQLKIILHHKKIPKLLLSPALPNRHITYEDNLKEIIEILAHL